MFGIIQDSTVDSTASDMTISGTRTAYGPTKKNTLL
jgi:hypothetical protein